VPDILHDFPIAASADRVFQAVASPAGLDRWWTVSSEGEPRLGAVYQLYFGPAYDWRAEVSRCVPDRAFELTLTRSDGDWTGSRVSFDLTPQGHGTQVCFRHLGWPAANEHFRISSYCWAMYLRLLRRYVELGEVVPYERRLDA
jgi:uncharacterized protein YndB with AHSA1/START domain